jgi:hypothetical protein
VRIRIRCLIFIFMARNIARIIARNAIVRGVASVATYAIAAR